MKKITKTLKKQSSLIDAINNALDEYLKTFSYNEEDEVEENEKN